MVIDLLLLMLVLVLYFCDDEAVRVGGCGSSRRWCTDANVVRPNIEEVASPLACVL